jgi:hypothetical protein
VIAGFHAFSSSKIDKQTVPEGYTFGWKSGGVNLPSEGMRYPFVIRRANAHTFRGLRWVIFMNEINRSRRFGLEYWGRTFGEKHD